jgi:sugar phosphate isomerase/epimerase
MQLKLYKTLWGFDGDHVDAVEAAVDAGFDGIEGPPPGDAGQRRRFKRALATHGLDYIAEICTAGSYVPDRRATVAEHLASLKQRLAWSRELNPRFVTSLAGCDAWAEQQSIDFFGSAMALAAAFELPISFETHRSRSLFNPWTTRRIATALPAMQLTVDFSHWCVVCERLMDTELDVIETLAPQVRHIHARVGYEQGPQVPHPAAPEYAEALHAHQRWWGIVWQAMKKRGFDVVTMTPEFGPDGYLHHMPFSQVPVADLDDLNLWMAETERAHFAQFLAASC